MKKKVKLKLELRLRLTLTLTLIFWQDLQENTSIVSRSSRSNPIKHHFLLSTGQYPISSYCTVSIHTNIHHGGRGECSRSGVLLIKARVMANADDESGIGRCNSGCCWRVYQKLMTFQELPDKVHLTWKLTWFHRWILWYSVFCPFGYSVLSLSQFSSLILWSFLPMVFSSSDTSTLMRPSARDSDKIEAIMNAFHTAFMENLSFPAYRITRNRGRVDGAMA